MAIDALKATTRPKNISQKVLHLIIITSITLLIFLLYQTWPWREWRFESGIWQWFAWLSSLDGLARAELNSHITGSLFIIPIVYASIVFNWKGAIIISAITITYSISQIGLWTSINSIVTNISLMIMPAAVIVAVKVLAESQRRNKEYYARLLEERQLYQEKVVEAQENERRHLSRELHDDTIQTFLFIAKLAQNITLKKTSMKKRDMETIAENIRNSAFQAVEDIRRIITDLRPSVLDDLGLVPAIRQLVDHTNKDTRINIVLLLNGNPRKYPSYVELNMFRVVQEAINNIRNHSSANEAIVRVEYGDESLQITVEDNGQGFMVPQRLADLLADDKLGLIGMQERMKSLNGNFFIQSTPDQGTLLSIDIQY